MPSSHLRRVLLVSVVAVLLPALALAQRYTRTDLTTDSSMVSPAPNIDSNLRNAWGLARSTGSPWWISDNGTGLSTLYNATGALQMIAGAPGVEIPTPDGTGTSAPTGAIFNPTAAFPVMKGGPKSIFIFVTEDGTIAGWNFAVDPTHAKIVKNRAGKAIYKGGAIAMDGLSPRFYATNFVTGRVEVFDVNFNRLQPNEDAFRFPGLGRDWSPFDIQNVGGNLVVTFAHRKQGSTDEDHGAGLGFVGVFDPRGHLLLRLQHGPWFNAPWGVALAPGDFGALSHRLLIGNFGDGTIQAFNAVTGRHETQMLDATTGSPLVIDGLWALSFGGDSTNNGLATTLFFTAGPNDEADGVFGNLTPLGSEQPGNSQ
jgi:uncharacterized protein (TIGR03118 family)